MGDKRAKVSVARMISILEKHILLGFTHENYKETSKLMNKLQSCIEPDDVRLLGTFWRDSYTDSCDAITLKTVVKQLKQKYRPGNQNR